MKKERIWDYLMQNFDEEDGFENIAQYKKGGFCPVHLGEVLDAGNYTVSDKLGHGNSSTVWLARDNQHNPQSEDHPYRYVALKFLTAERSQDVREISILRELQTLVSGKSTVTIDPDLAQFRQNIVHLIRSFSLQSANGLHTVLVLPVMRRFQELALIYVDTMRYYYEIARQLFGAVALLHQLGFTHGDLHINNAGFICSDMGDNDVQRMGTPGATPVVLWRYSTEHPSATSAFSEDFDDRSLVASPLGLDNEAGLPKYLVSSHTWNRSWSFKRFGMKTCVCIADFDLAFKISSPLSDRPFVLTPLCYIAPEYVFATHELNTKSLSPGLVRQRRRHGDAHAALGDVCQKVDVWSAGCILYEFILGSSLVSDFGINVNHEKRQVQIDPNVPDDWSPLPAVAIASAPDEAGKNPAESSADFWSKTLGDIVFMIGARCEQNYQFSVGMKRDTQPAPGAIAREDLEEFTNCLKLALRLDPRQRSQAKDICARLTARVEQLPATKITLPTE